MSEQQKDWHERIPRFLLTYRSLVHGSTCRSPVEVIFGTDIKLPGDLEFDVKLATEKDATCIGK